MSSPRAACRLGPGRGLQAGLSSASQPLSHSREGRWGLSVPSSPKALHKVFLAPKFEQGGRPQPRFAPASSGSAARPHSWGPSSPQGPPLSGSGGWALPLGRLPPWGGSRSLACDNRSSSQNHFPRFASQQTSQPGGQPHLPWGAPRPGPWDLPSRSPLTRQQCA